MGYYVNPPDQSKESFLRQNGRAVSVSEARESFATGVEMPVVLMDNGMFTAAGIGFSLAEFDAFTHPSDTRPKTIFLVKKELLQPYM